MTYRENEVRFYMSGSRSEYTEPLFRVGDGSFVIEEYSVSPGQDPEGRIAAKRYPIESGTLTFSVGRHGTEAVANWFNARIDNNHSTFGHSAGDLNFAMIGTLTLAIQDLKACTTQIYTFPHIALAQGHAGASNNWWFGSSLGVEASAEHTVISCWGTDSDGGRQKFTFKRGGAGQPYGQSVNEVEVSMRKD